jgi:hypothetical protein
MRESVLRDLIASQLVKLVAGGIQGVYPETFTGRAFRPQGQYAIQSQVVLSQLACSPASQVLSFLIMETESLVRLGRRLFPGRAREEALKLVVSANAEILNFVSSRVSWLLSKLEGAPGTEVSPPRVGNFSGAQSLRIRGEEGAFLDFECPAQDLGFKFISCIQCISDG